MPDFTALGIIGLRYAFWRATDPYQADAYFNALRQLGASIKGNS